MRIWSPLTTLIMGATITVGCGEGQLLFKRTQQSLADSDSLGLRGKQNCNSGTVGKEDSDEHDDDDDDDEGEIESGSDSDQVNLTTRPNAEKTKSGMIAKGKQKSKSKQSSNCVATKPTLPPKPTPDPGVPTVTPVPTPNPVNTTASAEQFYNATLKPALTQKCASCHSIALTGADSFAKASTVAKSGKLLSVSSGTGHPGGDRCGGSLTATPCAEIAAFVKLLP